MLFSILLLFLGFQHITGLLHHKLEITRQRLLSPLHHCPSKIKYSLNHIYDWHDCFHKNLSASTENKFFEAGFEIDLEGGIRIVSSEYDEAFGVDDVGNIESSGISKPTIIKLNNIAGGWGSGSHPTTYLCLEFLRENIKEGMDILDYGTGSGILSIYASKIGANRCIGVEVDDAAIQAATANCILNSVNEKVNVIHTKEVYVGDSTFPVCDITVANILAGALTRLVGVICGYTKPGGYICLSGIRPHELAGVKKFYEPFVDLETEQIKSMSHPVFGEWCRWIAKRKHMSSEEKQQAMDMLLDAGLG